MSARKSTEKLSPEQAMEKGRRYCAYQERSHWEVRKKLLQYGLYASEAEACLAQLIEEGFLQEMRFAEAFVGGKFRMKQWGRMKIEKKLRSHRLTPRCIDKALNVIDEKEYRQTLKTLLIKKMSLLAKNEAQKHKAAQFAIGKGYEPELVWETMRELEN
ncbi:MAG: RecX family transcriptional regulator [Candidatus Nephrothrix sp. EaCA]|nr:MAG: RecX family transcriptional regulator [Candidatus Nephrothrix sp. EaCA]